MWAIAGAPARLPQVVQTEPALCCVAAAPVVPWSLEACVFQDQDCCVVSFLVHWERGSKTLARGLYNVRYRRDWVQCVHGRANDGVTSEWGRRRRASR